MSDDGIPVALVSQVGDKVKKLVIAVRNAVKSASMIMGANAEAIKNLARESKIDENMIVNKKTGERSTILDENGMYAYQMTITRKKRSLGRNKIEVDMMDKEDEQDEIDEWSPF